MSYLAEVDHPPAVELGGIPDDLTDRLADDPLRLPYARPGGHQADLAWAAAVSRERGVTITGAPQQIRTWNLSSIWRLTTPVDRRRAWLKVVPPFFAHEGVVLPLLDPSGVPPVLGAEPGRVLLGEVPGEDQYEAPRPSLLEMVRMLVRLQAEWIDRTAELLLARCAGSATGRADAADRGRR